MFSRRLPKRHDVDDLHVVYLHVLPYVGLDTKQATNMSCSKQPFRIEPSNSTHRLTNKHKTTKPMQAVRTMTNKCHQSQVGPAHMAMALAQKTCTKMGWFGKWKHGLKPAVCPSWLILSHSHMLLQCNPPRASGCGSNKGTAGNPHQINSQINVSGTGRSNRQDDPFQFSKEFED